MEFEFKDHYRNISDDDLVNDIIAVAKKLGKDKITPNEYSLHGKYNRQTLWLRFGSWFNTMKKAGMKTVTAPRFIEEVNEESLFKNLACVWITLGKQPRLRDMKYPLSKFSALTYRKYFGTWMDGLRKFIEYQRAGLLSDAEIEKEISAWELVAAQAGEANKDKSIERDNRYIPLRLKFSVFSRDRFCCVACGRSPSTHPGTVLHCDHIRPWSRDGRTVFDNLQTLCSECNRGKGDRMITV